MIKNKNQRDPLPEQFESVAELAAFWDTHDTEDYPEAWKEVQVDVRIKPRPEARILLEPRLAQELDHRARRLGISLNDLVNQFLKEGLARSSR